MQAEDYEYVFYTSPKNSYFGLFTGACSIVFAMWGSIQSPLNVLVVIGALLVGIALLGVSFKGLFNTKPALKLGRAGLWTPKVGFLPWKHMQVMLKSVTGGKAGSLEYLIIKHSQTNEQLEVIPIWELSGHTEKLSNLLQQYKRN
ncbi:hypothetical protein [Hymenobacter sp. YC55]|uniref:hypothetical protein n=1 Tax=Hymenobacter sp. YC55 TaxID=3034019 RepID=UPI0023F673DA|nr:hypothetical protein [Hymenobacter sp. YC55]MDF7809790.1 hypothetical protein [Hymenobacter sp. YC55]